MNIAHFAPLSFIKSSGLTYSVPNLVKHQGMNEGYNIKLINTSKNIKNTGMEKNFADNIYLRYKDFNLNDIIKYDLIVFHSLYIYRHIKISRILNKKNIPYIIIPRGSMTQEAQNYKQIKKKIGNILFFNKFINNAKAIHYLSEGEKTNSDFEIDNCFIISNGINIPEKARENNNNELTFTFIGRKDINHKGLDLLIEGIKLLSKNICLRDIKFKLYGPDHNGSFKEINSLIEKYNLTEIINNLPGVFDQEKEKVLISTDVFIHTSRFEGHPMSVLEAMSYKIPCFLTPGTNMADITSRYNAGWISQPDPESISEKLNLIIKSQNKINEFGVKAKKLVKDNFTWEKVATKTLKKYKDIL